MKNLQTIRCKDVRYEDVGKYLEFDDGSEWYTRITAVSGDAVRTEVGVFNKNDIVCVARLKVPGSQYSGLYRSDQHPLVFRPERKELERVRAFMRGEFKGKLSRRELMITHEELKGELEVNGIDPNWIITKLKAEVNNARNRGFERIEAVKILARIGGVEIGENKCLAPKQQQPLFASFNVVTVQQQRRLEIEEQRKLGQAIEYVAAEISSVKKDDKEEEEENLAAPIDAE